MRKTFLALTLVVAGATQALAIGPVLDGRRVDAYLDDAPRDARVLERIVIGNGTERRTLVVTSAVILSKPEGCISCRDGNGVPGPFAVVAEPSDAAFLRDTPAGERISATVLRARSSRTVFMLDVTDGKRG